MLELLWMCPKQKSSHTYHRDWKIIRKLEPQNPKLLSVLDSSCAFASNVSKVPGIVKLGFLEFSRF